MKVVSTCVRVVMAVMPAVVELPAALFLVIFALYKQEANLSLSLSSLSFHLPFFLSVPGYLSLPLLTRPPL